MVHHTGHRTQLFARLHARGWIRRSGEARAGRPERAGAHHLHDWTTGWSTCTAEESGRLGQPPPDCRESFPGSWTTGWSILVDRLGVGVLAGWRRSRGHIAVPLHADFDSLLNTAWTIPGTGPPGGPPIRASAPLAAASSDPRPGCTRRAAAHESLARIGQSTCGPPGGPGHDRSDSSSARGRPRTLAGGLRAQGFSGGEGRAGRSVRSGVARRGGRPHRRGGSGGAAGAAAGPPGRSGPGGRGGGWPARRARGHGPAAR